MPSSSSSDDPGYHFAASDPGDGAGAVVLPRQADAAAVVSFLRAQHEVDEVCKKYGIPREQYTARPAGKLRASSAPPPGAVCVYAHALEAGMRVPLHPFFSDALAHFGIAPTQLAPNGWRIMAGFLVLCHTTGVPPSLAVFRHFFLMSIVNKKEKGWYFFRSRNSSGLCFTRLPHSIKDWKHGFFFLVSATPWTCPVEWGEPSKSSFMWPVLSGEEKKWAAKLLRAHGAAPVDITTLLCDSKLAAAMMSPVSPPPPSCTRISTTTSASSKVTRMDPSVYDMMKTMLADKVAAAVQASASAKKVKAEQVSSPLSGKKRSLDESKGAVEGPPSSVLRKNPPAADVCPVPPIGDLVSPQPELSRTPRYFASRLVDDSTDWKAAQEPLQERVFAASRPSYTLELEEKLRGRRAEIAALRKQLEETEGELAAAEEEAERERAQATAVTAAVRQLLESEERVLRRAAHALERYKRWKDGRRTARKT